MPQELYLKPSRVDHQIIPLGGLDLVPAFYFFDIAMFLDSSIDVDALQNSLVKTLEQIPVLAGKLVKDKGQWAIDTNSPGMRLIREAVDQPAPPHDDLAFSFQQDLFGPLLDLSKAAVSSLPLLQIKLTTFADGIVAVGMRFNHAVTDGTSFFLFLQQWDRNIRGAAEMKAADFSRQAIGQLAKAGCVLPSRRSGIGEITRTPAIDALQFVNTDFSALVLTSADCELLLARLKQSSAAGASLHDLLNALVFKAYADSSSNSAGKPALTNLAYDLRRVAGLGITPNFFGNAVLFRSAALSFGELRSIDILELVNWFKEGSTPNTDDIAQDIGFFQAQFEAGAYNSWGMYTNFAPLLANGGLFINNMIYRRNKPMNFGDALISLGLVLRPPLRVRQVLLSANPKNGDILIRLALETSQIKAFTKCWQVLLQALLTKP